MPWETLIAKDAAGTQYSITGQAADVYLSDGRTAAAALADIATQAANLDANITALTAAVTAATPTATS